MTKYCEIHEGFFSARVSYQNSQPKEKEIIWLKLNAGIKGYILFNVGDGSYPFGNRWSDNPDQLNFYDVKYMDATISGFRYIEQSPGSNFPRTFSKVSENITDVVVKSPIRMIEV